MARRARQKRLVGYPGLVAEAPPDVQISTGKVMRDSWSDPTDTTPTEAKAAREISAHRAFCPLRWCRRRHGERSRYTTDHIESADRLRAAWDGSRLGFRALKDWRPVGTTQFRPSMGPGMSAMKQLKCRVASDRMGAPFDTPSRALVVACLLRNMAIGNAAELFGWTKAKTTDRMVEILDRLCGHLDIGERRTRRRAA
jgi:hypothetical protein